MKHKIRFTLDSSAPAPGLPVIHHLAAKALITDWETAQKEKKSIVDLSIESSVISSHTAFIAVDEESSEPISSSMRVYDIQPSMRGHRFGSSMVSKRCFWSSGAPPPPGVAPSGSFGSPDLFASLSFGGPPPPSNCLIGNAFGSFSQTFSVDSVRGAPPLPPSTGLFGNAPQAPPPPIPLSLGAAYPPPLPLSKPCGGTGQQTKPTDTLASLISAQKLNGSWELTSLFAQLIGKPLADLEAASPIEREGVGPTVWATVLAVSLLRSQYSSQQDEWELIAMKAESWLKKQSLPSGITLEKIFEVAKKQTLIVAGSSDV